MPRNAVVNARVYNHAFCILLRSAARKISTCSARSAKNICNPVANRVAAYWISKYRMQVAPPRKRGNGDLQITRWFVILQDCILWGNSGIFKLSFNSLTVFDLSMHKFGGKFCWKMNFFFYFELYNWDVKLLIIYDIKGSRAPRISMRISKFARENINPVILCRKFLFNSLLRSIAVDLVSQLRSRIWRFVAAAEINTSNLGRSCEDSGRVILIQQPQFE